MSRAKWTAAPGVALALAAAMAAAAEAGPCEARITAVMATIAAGDLDTSRGPPLNAFLTLNPFAVGHARALDAAVAAGKPAGPLHCVPVAVKDNTATFDMPMTAGSLSLLGNQPPRDAGLVARLRAAGAIIVGKTNMDEFAFGIRGLSGAGGRVGNAYDPWRAPGGSSSGSGVAVGAGFVPLAVGSDNCGSLRIPAVYNGAVALRPTYGRFDSDGVFPMGFANGTPGLIARDAAGLREGLAVIDRAWNTAAATQGQPLRGRRIGVVVSAGEESLRPVAPSGERALAVAAGLLRQAGAVVIEDVAITGFAPAMGEAFVRGSAARIDAMLAQYPAARRNWADICGSGRIPKEWTEAECRSLTASDPAMKAAARDQVAANAMQVSKTFDRLDLDALVYLTDLCGGAQREATEDYTCFLSSASGLPAMALPVMLDGDGMPVGVELLGRAGSDEALVAFAAALEDLRGPFPPAPAPAAGPRLKGLGIAEQNTLRPGISWRAYQSREGEGLGDLDAARFRALVDETVASWPETKPP